MVKSKVELTPSEMKEIDDFEEFMKHIGTWGTIIAMSKDMYVVKFDADKKDKVDKLKKLSKKYATITSKLTKDVPLEGDIYSVVIRIKPEAWERYTELTNKYEDSLKGQKVTLPKKNFKKFSKPPLRVDFRKMI